MNEWLVMAGTVSKILLSRSQTAHGTREYGGPASRTRDLVRVPTGLNRRLQVPCAPK